MFNIVSLVVVAALVSLQCDFVANAVIDTSKLEMDNNLQPNVFQPIPEKKRGKHLLGLVMAKPPPKTAQLLPGSILELTCQVTASPPPTINWLKNGEPISEFIESNKIPAVYLSIAEMTSKLLIRTAASGDEYTCLARSGAVERSATTTVITLGEQDEDDLLEKLLLMPYKPTVTTYYKSLLQEIGTSIVLPCRADGFTKTQTFWQDPSTGDVIYNDGHRRVLPSGDLFISKVNFSDTGNYTCTAKNLYGKETVTTFLYAVKS